MKPRTLMPVVTVIALLGGAEYLMFGSRRPDEPGSPFRDLPTPAERKATLQRELADLQTRHDRLSAELTEREAESVRWLTLSPLLRALEPNRDLGFSFIGIVSRDSSGSVSACEAWHGRIPSDYAGYIDPMLGATAGTWIIGRLKEAGEMSYSTRFCHEVTPTGEVLGTTSPTPVMLDDLRTRIAAKYPPR